MAGDAGAAVRDVYGFLVPPERVAQYRKDAVVVMEREEAQAEAWERFLEGEAEALRAAEAAEAAGGSAGGLEGKAPDAAAAAAPSDAEAAAGDGGEAPSDGDGAAAGARRSSSSDDLVVLRSKVLRRVLDEPPESPARRRLGALVEGGVPMAMRKFVWPLFLDKHEEVFDAYIGARHSSSASSSTKATFIKSIYLKSHARKKFAPLPDYRYQLKNISVSCTGWVEQIKKVRTPKRAGRRRSAPPRRERADAGADRRPLIVRGDCGTAPQDLPRTFPHHPALEGRGRSALGRVLAAYVAYNSVDGYCQGMNFIAGLLILFLPEETAFRSFAQLLKCILQGYHAQDLKTLLVDQLVFDQLLKERFPDVEEHLTRLGVKSSAVTAHWFLTAFVNTLQMQALLRVWDVLLYEGSISVLMRMALAMVRSRREIVLAMEDSADVLAALQQMPANTSTGEMDELLEDVCCNYPEVTDDKINELRLENLKTVDEEARSLVNRKPSEMSKFFTKLSSSVSKSLATLSASSASSASSSEPPGAPDAADAAEREGINRSMSACVTRDERRHAAEEHATTAAAAAEAEAAPGLARSFELALAEERMLKEAAMRELESTREEIRQLRERNALLEERISSIEGAETTAAARRGQQRDGGGV